MKRILSIILILIGFSAFAQPSNEGQYQASYARWKQKVPLWADSGIYVKKIAKMSNQNRVCVFDSVTGKTGYKYITTSTSSGWDLSGNSLSDGQFLGSTNDRDLRIRTNNVEWVNFDSSRVFELKSSASGATLGSELITLAADRDFSSNTGNWTGTNWTITGGKIEHTAGANNLTLSNSALNSPPSSGNYYLVTFQVYTTTIGQICVSYGGQFGVCSGKILTGAGYNQIEILILASSSTVLTLAPNAAWVGSLDNFSIKQITSNNPVFKAFASTGSNANGIYNTGSNTFSAYYGLNAGVNATTSATSNAAFGYNAGTRLLTGTGNAIFGTNSAPNLTTGSGNSIFGNGAAGLLERGTANVAIGQSALNQLIEGIGNVAVGYNANGNNINGQYNTSTGYNAGAAMQTGDYNCFYGYASGQNANGGIRNNFFGASSGYSLGGGTGNRNNIHGTSAGDSLGSGSDNAFFGDLSGNTLARGNRNSFFGGRSGELARDSDNVFLGYLAGGSQRAGSNNLAIGSQINTQSSSASNQISIRNIIFGTGVVGTGTTTATGKLGIKYPNPLFGFSVNAKVGLNKDSITVSSGQEWYLTLDTTTTPNQVKRQKVSSSSYSAGNGLLLGGTTFYADTTKIASLHGNAWGNGMFSGTTNNRSIFWRTNNLYRGAMDSTGRFLWGGTFAAPNMIIADDGSATSLGGFKSIAYNECFQRVGFNNGSNYNAMAYIISPSAGIVRFLDATEADFNRIQLGGSTTSFPSIKRNGANVSFRKADDSDFTGILVSDINIDKTITASGTTGSRTINKTCGCVNFAAASGAITVTNSYAASANNYVVIATLNSVDATMKGVSVSQNSGSFTLTPDFAPTTETRVCFMVIPQ